MVGRCVVMGCSNTSYEGPVHQWPKSEHYRRIWTKFVRVHRANFRHPPTGNQDAKICFAHFNIDCYTQSIDERLHSVLTSTHNRKAKPKLKYDACPTVHANVSGCSTRRYSTSRPRTTGRRRMVNQILMENNEAECVPMIQPAEVPIPVPHPELLEIVLPELDESSSINVQCEISQEEVKISNLEPMEDKHTECSSVHEEVSCTEQNQVMYCVQCQNATTGKEFLSPSTQTCQTDVCDPGDVDSSDSKRKPDEMAKDTKYNPATDECNVFKDNDDNWQISNRFKSKDNRTIIRNDCNMATFDTVPVIDVHTDNFSELWPTMILALKSSTFVALDLEMSGLGNRRLLLAKSIEDRYNTLCEVASTRSVVSLGISCFKLQPAATQGGLKQKATAGDSSQEEKTNLHFFVQTFNIILLCKESYMVEPESLRFLVQHGFDFNKQYSKGISYHRGLDKPEDEKQSIRLLLNEIITNKVPIALHNGLVDLVFLYHAFYSTVPSKLEQFVADLSEIFAGGIYDTKYIVEYEVRLASSYLEYVFRKSQKDNVQKYHAGTPHIKMSFPHYPASCSYIEYQECGLPEETRNYTGLQTCDQFGAFGWCRLADNCPKSHDIDAILNIDDNVSSNKRKKRSKQKNKRQKINVASVEEEKEEGTGNEEEMETVDNTQGTITKDTSSSSELSVGQHLEKDHSSKPILSSAGPNQVNSGTTAILKTDDTISDTVLSTRKHKQKDTIDSRVNALERKSTENGDKIAKSRCTGHRAGFDAFMTGYTLASAVLKCGKLSVLQTSSGGATCKLADLKLDKLKNNVYLSGKDMPLKITKSNFSKASKEHRVKYEKLMGDDGSMVT